MHKRVFSSGGPACRSVSEVLEAYLSLKRSCNFKHAVKPKSLEIESFQTSCQQRYKFKMPYFEKSLQASLSLNHVVSKTAKPPLVFLSFLFSQSVDTTGWSS